MNKKFPFVASFICLIAVFILCRLGVWQVERLHWKNNLQVELDTAFSINPPPKLKLDDIQNLKSGQIIRGSLNGKIDFSKPALFYGRIDNGRSVTSVIVPLRFNDMTIAVEIGCHEKPTSEMISALNQSDISVSGVIRIPSKPSFAVPSNIIEKNEWWRFDDKALASFWNSKTISPVLMTTEDTTKFSNQLIACPIEKKLRNDHFSYAIFWFSMAFILVIIWGIRFLKPYIRRTV